MSLIAARHRSGFRNDINGLRAWAVVAVVLYHFGIPGLHGGFSGVDVFFVISGFLMTGIVIRGLEKGHFSLQGFYLARARRIIPALAVLCLVLFVAGRLYLFPQDYRSLATHAISSLGFLSNFKFWDEAGYFDQASHEKWLLHTWSLSVEWQFYMILPVVLGLAWRIRPGRATQLLVVFSGFLISLLCSIVFSPRDASAAFYLLHTRAWEMLAGGLVFLFSGHSLTPHVRRGLEMLGIAMIVTAVLVFDARSVWPGGNALVPVAGAMMVLLAAREGSLWTGNSLAQWLGDRSYSLYLWHWPVYVGLVYAELQRQPIWIASGVVASLILAHFSYILVEVRCRRALEDWAAPRATAVIAGAMLLVLIPAVTIRAMEGMPGRFQAKIEAVANEATNLNPRRGSCHPGHGLGSPSCGWGGSDWGITVLGDSHALSLMTAVVDGRPDPDIKVVQWTYSGCAFVYDRKTLPEFAARMHPDYRCNEFIDWVDGKLSDLPSRSVLVLAGNYAVAALGDMDERVRGEHPDVYFTKPPTHFSAEFTREFAARLTDTACRLAENRRVILVRPIPEMGFNVPRTLARRLAFGLEGDVSVPVESYRARNDWVWKAQDEARARCGVDIVDPTRVLCDENRCYGSVGLQPVYVDDNHLSETGSRLVAPLFREILQAGS